MWTDYRCFRIVVNHASGLTLSIPFIPSHIQHPLYILGYWVHWGFFSHHYTLSIIFISLHTEYSLDITAPWGFSTYDCPLSILLTHWGRDKMDAISQTTFGSTFSWMKVSEFRLKFHWRLFLRSNWQYSSIGLDNGLAPSTRQAITWTNDG